ncbi:MAG: hypothetical protein ACJASS_001689 [Sulfitobacter sp.]|jgi:hypothetical protein
MGFRSVADDLGVGMSTLNKWIAAHRDTDVGHRRVGRLMRRNRVKLIAQSCVARATLSGKSRRFESASLSSTARAILACLSQTR